MSDLEKTNEGQRRALAIDSAVRALAIDSAVRALVDALQMEPAPLVHVDWAYSIGMDAWDAVIGDSLGPDRRGRFKDALSKAIQKHLANRLTEDMRGHR